MADRPDIFQLNLDPGGSLAITRSTNAFPPEDVTTVYTPADTLTLLDFLTEHADTIRTSAVRADRHNKIDEVADLMHTLIDVGAEHVTVRVGQEARVSGKTTKAIAAEILGHDPDVFPEWRSVTGVIDGIYVTLHPVGGEW